MTIEYALYPNPLTDGPDDQRAIVQNQESRTTEDVIDEIISRGSTVTRAEALAVIEEYEAIIAKFIADGDRVNTDLMRVSCSISGVFEGTDDQFDSSRHQVNLNFSAGPRLQEATEDTVTEKVRGKQRRPRIRNVEDHGSGTNNSTLTPGDAINITGSMLKHDPNDKQQGVFLLAADGTEIKMDPAIYNKPKTLIVMVPADVPSGEYELEVRSIVRRTATIRRGRFDSSLRVS